jgi:hypothetical protein
MPAEVYLMCEVRLSSASGGGGTDEAQPRPVRGNRATEGAAFSCDLRALSRYRVLRGASRGALRSVDRECAGRNAISVKDVEPRQTNCSVVAEHVWPRPGNRLSEGSTSREAGTTGVQDHGMYIRQVAVRLRSAAIWAVSSRPRPITEGQGLRPKSPGMSSAEVRCPRSSDEAGQLRWSEGGHGE